MSCLKYFTVLVLLIVQSSHVFGISGGKEVTPHSLPFMALLRQKKHLCGGALIDPLWVLTSASCESINKVLLGVHSISNDQTNTRQVRNIVKEIPHPFYNEVTGNNDLMLAKLDKSVMETDTVKYLKLTIKEPTPGTSCLVAGWGETNFTPTASDVLRSVNVTVTDRKKCKSFYNKSVITNNMICAGGINADSCAGDGGGPLVCGSELVGVTSFGQNLCGGRDIPGVYSFVSEEQLKWISETMLQNMLFCAAL